MQVQELIRTARAKANDIAQNVKINDTSGSNGSEAWQAVVIDVDGRSKAAKELKALGIEKDYYWGFTVTPMGYNNYFAEAAWVREFAKELNLGGLKARTVERLL